MVKLGVNDIRAYAVTQILGGIDGYNSDGIVAKLIGKIESVGIGTAIPCETKIDNKLVGEQIAEASVARDSSLRRGKSLAPRDLLKLGLDVFFCRSS